MKYKYLNPRTGKYAETAYFNSDMIEQLLENKENDVVLATSFYSKTFKVFKYHFAGYAGDWEGAECITECPVSTLKYLLTL